MCKICGSIFTPEQFNQAICSFNCKVESNRMRSLLKKREKTHWEPKEIKCRFCHKKFFPINSSQRFHDKCSQINSQLKTPFRYFQICTECRNVVAGYIINKLIKKSLNRENILDAFYSCRNWCKICKNKINENRRHNKPTKAERFIFDCLNKYFPGDDIVLLDRRQIRYKGWWWEIDIYNRTRRFGFEYDEARHFSDFGQQRNSIKDELCKEQHIKLIRIKYTEPLTEQLILSKLSDNGIFTS